MLVLCIVYLLAAKPWICEQCGKDFREEYALNHHYLVHKETREHICGICSKGYGNFLIAPPNINFKAFYQTNYALFLDSNRNIRWQRISKSTWQRPFNAHCVQKSIAEKNRWSRTWKCTMVPSSKNIHVIYAMQPFDLHIF